jgi:hypothetical protein
MNFILWCSCLWTSNISHHLQYQQAIAKKMDTWCDLLRQRRWASPRLPPTKIIALAHRDNNKSFLWLLILELNFKKFAKQYFLPARSGNCERRLHQHHQSNLLNLIVNTRPFIEMNSHIFVAGFDVVFELRELPVKIEDCGTFLYRFYCPPLFFYL